jgi:DNA-binding XRE family transcriptional regulator
MPERPFTLGDFKAGPQRVAKRDPGPEPSGRMLTILDEPAEELQARAEVMVRKGDAPTVEQARVKIVEDDPVLRDRLLAKRETPAEPEPHPVAKLLRAERKARGRIQAEVAEAGGLTQQQVSMFETSAVRPSWATVSAYARGLGLDLTDLRRLGIS